jgi:hypothetical protein
MRREPLAYAVRVRNACATWPWLSLLVQHANRPGGAKVPLLEGATVAPEIEAEIEVEVGAASRAGAAGC